MSEVKKLFYCLLVQVRQDVSWKGAPPAPLMADRRVEITVSTSARRLESAQSLPEPAIDHVSFAFLTGPCLASQNGNQRIQLRCELWSLPAFMNSPFQCS